MPYPAGDTQESDAILGSGTDFAYSLDGATYHSVEQVEDLKFPEMEIPKVDKTSLLSPNAAREKRAGLSNLGECEAKCIFKSSMMETLYGIAQSRATIWWRIILPDGASTGTTVIWRGFITNIGGEIPLEDNVMATVKVEGTDILVYTAAT